MALYALDEFKSLVVASKWCFLNKRRTFKTLDKLDWTDQDLVRLLLSLQPNDFQKVELNRKINDFPDQDYVDADRYEIHWDSVTGERETYPTKMTTFSLSLKIAIMTDAQGQSAGVVTFHMSGSCD